MPTSIVARIDGTTRRVSRLKVRAPGALRRRPLRARRLVAAQNLPIEYAAERATPRSLIVGTGVLGVLVTIELVIGVVVVSL